MLFVPLKGYSCSYVIVTLAAKNRNIELKIISKIIENNIADEIIDTSIEFN
jgi:hypothetical protein